MSNCSLLSLDVVIRHSRILWIKHLGKSSLTGSQSGSTSTFKLQSVQLRFGLYFVTVQSISHRCDFYRIHRCDYGCIYTNHNYINPNTLDKSVRMVYYHFSNVLFGRVWRCSLLYIWIMRACLLCPYVKYYFTIDVCTNSVFTLDIFVV